MKLLLVCFTGWRPVCGGCDLTGSGILLHHHVPYSQPHPAGPPQLAKTSAKALVWPKFFQRVLLKLQRHRDRQTGRDTVRHRIRHACRDGQPEEVQRRDRQTGNRQQDRPQEGRPGTERDKKHVAHYVFCKVTTCFLSVSLSLHLFHVFYVTHNLLTASFIILVFM